MRARHEIGIEDQKEVTVGVSGPGTQGSCLEAVPAFSPHVLDVEPSISPGENPLLDEPDVSSSESSRTWISSSSDG